MTSSARSARAVTGSAATARWQRLHKLVYLIAGLGLLHFFWLRAGKNNFNEVFVYAGIVAVLLAWRVWYFVRQKKAVAPRAAVPRAQPSK